MQLFSRNKAIVALSLGALALGACGDDVTVPVAPAAPITLSITPPSANMNIGEAVNFAVQISGGATAPTLASCTTSSATVATAAVSGSSCRVTAIAAGNATITATASTGQSAAASVSVAAPAAAISGLQVSPSAASVQVNQTVTIVPTANKGAAAVAIAYTYASSSASVATVTAAGVVTAVAPGVATITVTATGTGTGFTTTTLTSAAAITVTALPSGMTSLNVTPSTLALSTGATAQIVANAQQPTGAAAASIIYGTTRPAVATVSSMGLITAVGPGTAVITVTATSAANANFAAATLSGSVAVTVSPNAQVSIVGLLNGILPIDLASVSGQFEAQLSIQPNGQNVSAVNFWVCNENEAVLDCATRSGTPAAQQAFGPSGAPTGQVSVFVNTADFKTPNFTTGEDAQVSYPNGPKTLVATLAVAGSLPTASNTVSSVNFTNTDGFTLKWTLPTNKANSSAGNTYYGGPAASGIGSFVVVPVMYSGKKIMQVTLNAARIGNASACGNDIIDNTRPFAGSYGVQAYDSATVAFNCAGAATDLDGHAPGVYASLTDAGTAGPIADTGFEREQGESIYCGFANTALNNGCAPWYFRTSSSYRPVGTFVAADYQAPVISKLEVRGGGLASPDSGWVNGTYAFNEVTNTATGETRYTIADAAVGLLTARNTVFNVCNTPAFTPGVTLTAAVPCTTPVATGGLTATVAGMGLQENATNLENTAYFITATETDRLGNSTTSNAFAYTVTNANGSLTNVPATTSGTQFGVDRTAPQIVAIPAPALVEPASPSLSGFARTTVDSIFSTGGATVASNTTAILTDVAISATNALFAVRAKDERSGFYACTAGNCYTNSGVRLGTFGITRRIAPASPSAANDATVQNIVSSALSTGSSIGNSMNGIVPGTDNTVRQFSINIFGDAGRAPTALSSTIGAAQSGYYTFTGTLVDRAGNTTAVPTRNVVIDNAAPTINSVITNAAAFYTGGQTSGVTLQASDDLEIMGAELTLGTPAMNIRFPRVTAFASTIRTGLFQNPFAALTSNKLANLTGLGQTFNGAINLPIPFLQDLQVLATASTTVTSPAALDATVKPTSIAARVFDIRSMATLTGYTTGSWSTNAFSAPTSLTINSNQVSTPTIRKNWGADDAVNNNAGAKIATWSVYSATSTAVEFRVTATSSSASVPFNAVRVVTRRQDATLGTYDADYEYRGVATFTETLDEGGVRVFRYLWTVGSAVAQGANVSQAGFTGLDSIRAIGTDANGNGLVTAAAIPGATTVPRVISAIAIGTVNVFSPTATPGSNSLGDWTLLGGWFTRTGSTSVTATAASIAGDTRAFIEQNASLATARIYATLTVSPGAAVTTSGNTTVTCTSNTADVVVVGQGIELLQSTASTNTVRQAYCDVRGATDGPATITITAARAAEAPYAAATATNTSITTTVWSGADNITGLGALSVADLNGAGTWQAVGGTSTSRKEIFTIGGMTGFNSAIMTPVYQVNRTTTLATTGGSVSATSVANSLTGGATITVTCNATSANQAFTLEILGRATSLNGYSAPQRTTINGTCQ